MPMLDTSLSALPVVLRQYPVNLFIPKSLPGSKGAPAAASVSVSAVIPTYKPPQELKALVRTLLSHPCVRQVVVVDDATPSGVEYFFFGLSLIPAQLRPY